MRSGQWCGHQDCQKTRFDMGKREGGMASYLMWKSGKRYVGSLVVWWIAMLVTVGLDVWLPNPFLPYSAHFSQTF